MAGEGSAVASLAAPSDLRQRWLYGNGISHIFILEAAAKDSGGGRREPCAPACLYPRERSRGGRSN